MTADPDERTEGAHGAPSPLRRWSFRIAVALASLVLTVGLAPALKGLFVNWLPQDLFLAVRTDLTPDQTVHRLHSTVVAMLFWCLIIGLFAQLWRPTERVALLAMSFAVLVAEAIAELLSGTYTILGTGVPLAILAVIAALHPAKLRASWFGHWHRWSVLLALAAAGPLAALATVASGQQRAAPVGSIDFRSGHLAFVAAFGILLILLALLSASSIPGWRPLGWAVALLASAFALQSLLFPLTLNAVSPFWAFAGLAWGVGLVIVTERRVGGAASSGPEPTWEESAR